MTEPATAPTRLGRLLQQLRFDPATEARFRADYTVAAREYRAELWLRGGLFWVLLTLVYALGIGGRPTSQTIITTAAAICATWGLWWVDRLTGHRWSTALFIATVFTNLMLVMSLRVVGPAHGPTGMPFIVPATVIGTFMVAGIRLRILVPVMTSAIALLLIVELGLVADHESLYTLCVIAAITLVSLASTFEAERTSRAGWLRDRRLTRLSLTDSLTGLPTRRALDVEIERILDTAAGPRLALAILDLDDFTGYNNRFGHVVGDECLRKVGSYLRQATDEETEFVARLAGEEFVVLWRDVDPHTAANRVEALRAGISVATTSPDLPDPVTASAGFATADDAELPRGTGTQLLRNADRALYAAKRSGRNRTAHSAEEVVATAIASDRITTPATAPVHMVGGARLPHDLERRFQDSLATPGFRIGSIATLVIATLWFQAFVIEALVTQQSGSDRVLALGFLVAGLLQLVAVIITISSPPRLRRFASPVFLAILAMLMAVLVSSHESDFSLTANVIPVVAGLAVMLGACVVQVRFRVLCPVVVVMLIAFTVVDIGLTSVTSERIVIYLGAWYLIGGALRFAQRIEAARRLAWMRTWQLEQLAQIDPMTGLPNRRQYAENVATALASGAENVAVILIDVDHFKDFNDRWGHLAGDRCLRRIGRTLARICAAEGAVLARIGGDEFAVAVAGNSRDKLRALAELMVDEVARMRIPTPTPMAHATVSAGIAFHGVHAVADNPAACLLARADHALYEAKELGRARYAIAPDGPSRHPRPSGRG